MQMIIALAALTAVLVVSPALAVFVAEDFIGT